MNSLSVDVSGLVKSIGSEKRIKERIKPSPFSFCDEELSFATPLDVDIIIRNVGGGLLAEGCAKGTVRLHCSRCLRLYDADFCLDIREAFCASYQQNDKDTLEIIEGNIDLYPLIKQGLLLWLPMKQLCRVDCLGLCPKCGKDLNKGSCSCQKDQVDPRLATLKDFFKK